MSGVCHCPHDPGVLAMKLRQFGGTAGVAKTIRFTGQDVRHGVTPRTVRNWIWALMPSEAGKLLKHGGRR